MKIQIRRKRQGQHIIAPNGGKNAESCDAYGTFVEGRWPGERGSEAHSVNGQIKDEQRRPDYG